MTAKKSRPTGVTEYIEAAPTAGDAGVHSEGGSGSDGGDEMGDAGVFV